ncbi:MAG TPA: ABC transporter ATP-binding protein [Acidimicrobiia bacterium]|nr:ABC transporter ATP-binding protein [Acidimicrobiia bacterium]
MTLLTVEDLSISFVQYEAGLRRRKLDVVTGLDLEAARGEVVAVVGASGSGKSLLAHAVLGLLPSNAIERGKILYDGAELDDRRRRELRGRDIALVPQSVAFLDPVTRVGDQVERAARLIGEPEPARAAEKALRRRHLPEGVEKLYPHQLSGGMARRILAAIATIGRPSLIIADEPTPGLHEAVVAETLTDLRRVADDGAGVVLITHDLEGALTVADRVAVFYAGTTVEQTRAEAFQGDGEALAHPYSRALWRALPAHGFQALPGGQPAPDDLPSGCLFADRCPLVADQCRDNRPLPRRVGGATVRCIRA